MSAAPILELRGIYGGYAATTVLRDIDLVVRTESVAAILGSNGAGKTTLLRTISGIIPAQRGKVLFDGEDITRVSTYRRARLGLCHIPEGRGVFRRLTVRDNLIVQARRGHEAKVIERSGELFPILQRRMSQIAGTLSGGEQQMLALARAYTTEPRLVLVDEASLGLAPVVVESIFDFLRDLATNTQSSLVIVDQFVAQVMPMADQVHILRRGSIVRSATPAELGDLDVFSEFVGDVATHAKDNA